MHKFMRVFFHLLYHPFAFTYDLVAAFVSLGRWKDWVSNVIPHLQGNRILELGHGPGHLQRLLLNLGLDSVALDESTQMGNLARRRLGLSAKLTRGLAQDLPFQNGIFDSVVATFPTEYIFDPRTLSEVKRVLRNSGRLIVLPAAFPKSGFLQWLYRVTGQNPAALDDIINEKYLEPFAQAGFFAELKLIELNSGSLLIIIAVK